MDQVTRSKLLKEMPTLDDTDVIVQQVRDASWDVQIPETDDAGSQRGAGSGKGKEKVAMSGSASKEGSRSLPRDIGASPEPTAS
jgi:hypothetical protein